MTDTTIKRSTRLINSSALVSKPSTITRAAITAEIKPSRGKQLVEHNPFSLIPDPANPRPGEVIDDLWLINNLKLGTDLSLCYYDDVSREFYIPEISELDINSNEELEESYNFLKSLAVSIRNDGLIEPIEIFLADKNNDPEYFKNSTLDYGYVVLEGHQRRLAAMIAGVKTVTCIEITDETMLAKLKVKHRKLRRQLSENNLRKGLTVAQNFLIVKELLKNDGSSDIPIKELSSIIGLNQDIAAALRKICMNEDKYPEKMIKLIESNRVSFKWIRLWIGKSPQLILDEVTRLLSASEVDSGLVDVKLIKPKARGRSGGAVKKMAVFKIKNEQDTLKFHKFLLERMPELTLDYSEKSPFSCLEQLLEKIMDLARAEDSTQVE